MIITTDDYDVINAYAEDLSWHSQFRTCAGMQRMIDSSKAVVDAYLVRARQVSRRKY